MKKTDLKKFAKVLVVVGANVKKNQEVIINSPIHAATFTEYVVEAAYKKGAKKVTVNWSNSNLTKLNYKYQKVETLCEVAEYEIMKQKYNAKVLPAVINIASPNPDALKGVDTGKMAQSSKANSLAFKEIKEEMDGKFQWTIAAFPNEAWAKKVFPNLSSKAGVKELWNAIVKCSRLDGDPIVNWKEHNENILNKRNMLTELKIKTLNFKSGNGTDFSIDLFENTNWAGGGLNTNKKVYFFPNIPTEETFTSPNPNSANGIVYSSKPLSVRGTLVDNFGFRFENGIVTEVLTDNETHKEVLEALINTDDGAKKLGEVALVPFSSPINQTGLLFFNTLFDENAVCHLALGRAFNFTIDNYDKMTREEIKSFGLNDSLIHVDFMIGTKDMNVVATTYSGEVVQIFKDGEWV